MDFKRLKKEMNQAIIQVPSINTYGIIPADSSSFDDMQNDLFNSLEEFYWCQEWLKKCQLRKTFNTNHSSYGYKHMVEDWICRYVSNGTFIAAAIALQIPYKPTSLNSPNIYLPISEKCFARDTTGRFYLKEAVPGSNAQK